MYDHYSHQNGEIKNALHLSSPDPIEDKDAEQG
jgi:hypothetical protein